MKYGNNALKDKEKSPGLIKHLQDIESFIADKGKYINLLETMEKQFDQLDKLGLLKFKKVKQWTNIRIDPDVKPEVVVILANHKPRGIVLKEVLSDPRIDQFENSPNFDLRFYVSCYAGYALHADCMKPLNEFRKLISLSKYNDL